MLFESEDKIVYLSFEGERRKKGIERFGNVLEGVDQGCPVLLLQALAGIKARLGTAAK